MFSAPRIALASGLSLLTACGLIMSSEDKEKVVLACNGEAVEGTKAHEKGPEGFMVFVQDEPGDAYSYSADGVHMKLKSAKKLPEVNTVFCMDAPVEVPQGECAFDSTRGIWVGGVQVVETNRSKGPTFPRVGMRRSARLVDPATGQTIAEHTVDRDAPACDAFVGDPTASAFRASPPSGIGFADWATAQLGVTK